MKRNNILSIFRLFKKNKCKILKNNLIYFFPSFKNLTEISNYHFRNMFEISVRFCLMYYIKIFLNHLILMRDI